MPSTRGMGSKMMWRCSALLFGVKPVSSILPKSTCGRPSGHWTVESSTGSPCAAN